ncbi:MAG TPA: hypothetical protein VHE35_23155 [Kofleriaceae bacterium]|nr:hypothetical protein [Kofleriaceae bacterium]
MTTPSLDDLRARFAACGSLAEAILAGLALAPAWSVVDVVVQDEFTHDVVLAAAAGGPAIVLDCT